MEIFYEIYIPYDPFLEEITISCLEIDLELIWSPNLINLHKLGFGGGALVRPCVYDRPDTHTNVCLDFNFFVLIKLVSQFA